jgi:hypothetical protein
MSEQRVIAVKRTEDHDWQQLWLDDVLWAEGHSLSSADWMSVLKHLNVKVQCWRLEVDPEHGDLTGECTLEDET